MPYCLPCSLDRDCWTPCAWLGSASSAAATSPSVSTSEPAAANTNTYQQGLQDVEAGWGSGWAWDYRSQKQLLMNEKDCVLLRQPQRGQVGRLTDTQQKVGEPQKGLLSLPPLPLLHPPIQMQLLSTPMPGPQRPQWQHQQQQQQQPTRSDQKLLLAGRLNHLEIQACIIMGLSLA